MHSHIPYIRTYTYIMASPAPTYSSVSTPLHVTELSLSHLTTIELSYGIVGDCNWRVSCVPYACGKLSLELITNHKAPHSKHMHAGQRHRSRIN